MPFRASLFEYALNALKVLFFFKNADVVDNARISENFASGEGDYALPYSLLDDA